MGEEGWKVKAIKTFNQLFKEAEKSNEFHVFGVLLQFSEDVVFQMHMQGISKKNLARRLKCKQSDLADVFRCGEDIPLAKMVTIARALNCKMNVSLTPND